MGEAAESLARRFEVMRPHLNEFQRRLWLGAEAAELGPGGVAVVAGLTGVAADTVRRGRAEAGRGEAPAPGRSRRPGGGRRRAEAHDDGLVAALEALVDPVSRGDPMSPLRWTCKSTRALARALTGAGHPVSEFVVRRLLRQAGYSLQAPAKTIEGARHPDRDAQFRYINDRVTAYLAAGDPVTRGDPMSPLRWTCKSTRTLARALAGAGHPVSDFVVRRLLRQLGYSLQANAKVSEGSRQHPDRDAQFRYINDQVTAYLAARDPVISVDAKKKENVGGYKNGGREWQPKGSPEQVNVHDFIDKELGKVTPYGVYDVGANAGWVSVGTDHDTAAFAVACGVPKRGIGG